MKQARAMTTNHLQEMNQYALEPTCSEVMYVNELIVRNTFNTLPLATIKACADHCNAGDRLKTGVEEAYALIENLKNPDINNRSRYRNG